MVQQHATEVAVHACATLIKSKKRHRVLVKTSKELVETNVCLDEGGFIVVSG